MKTRWPWITVVLALAVGLFSPVNGIIHSAVFSGEQLARTLSQLVLMELAGVLFVLCLIEWGIRWYAARRRAAALQNVGQVSPAKES